MEAPREHVLPDQDPRMKYFRAAIGAFVFILVLAIYPYTSDPTGHIKHLFIAWSALALGIWWIAAIWAFGLPARRC